MNSRFPRIACTLGTTTDDAGVLRAMAAAGMGLCRVNTAHGSMAELAGRMDLLRASVPTPLLLDLKGPQLRLECVTERADPETGRVQEVPCRYPVARGELVWVGFGSGPVRFNHDFRDAVGPGDLVTFENGRIRTRVRSPEEAGVEPVPDALLLEVFEAGEGRLAPGMGANVPGRALGLSGLTPRDREAAALGVARRADWYALSFARGPGDLLGLHRALLELGDSAAGLMPKIEDAEGVRSLERIVEAARSLGRPLAVMVARGDLFVELPAVKLPAVQADLVRRCRSLGVPVQVATGLLLSMQTEPFPARSEVCDVAAALAQGAASLLLSDETSNGRDPVRAVQVLAELWAEYGTVR